MEIKGKQAIRELIQKIGAARLIIIVLAGIMLLVFSMPSEKASFEEDVTATETGAGQESSAALSAM